MEVRLIGGVMMNACLGLRPSFIHPPFSYVCSRSIAYINAPSYKIKNFGASKKRLLLFLSLNSSKIIFAARGSPIHQ
jgi:hypothetical protein